MVVIGDKATELPESVKVCYRTGLRSELIKNGQSSTVSHEPLLMFYHFYIFIFFEQLERNQW